ncbi:MAG TPA: pitrilysin family protein [Terriglobia bacterium]|nr:pitrilysin family protein [Terriglobia bacterium]
MNHRLMTIMAALAVAASMVGSLQARDLPPLVPQPAPVAVPAPVEQTLGNGMKVLVVQDHALPVITLKIAVLTGAAADPASLPGTAQFVASMLNEGTRSRSAQEIAEAIDGMGGVFDSGADWDDSWASLSVLSNHAQQAFDLLSDMAINPAFRPAEVERVRRQTLSALDVLRRDPDYLADTLIERVIFNGTPYSHPKDGVRESVQRLSRDDLARFHDRYYQPSNAVLVVVGDVSTAQALDLAKSAFGGWKAGEPHPARPSSPAEPPAAPRVVVIDDPNAVQTEIRIANLAFRRNNPDYDALAVANQVLGGPAENRLFSELRIRRGLVYGASSDLVCYRNAGAWEIKTSTRTDETIKTVSLILSQMNDLEDGSINGRELQNAQNYLIGHMALDFETSQQIADHVLSLIINDLPMDALNHRAEQIRKLSIDDVSTAARRHLNSSQAAIILVGNAEEFKHGLKSFGPARIIPLTDVDFAASTLEQPAHDAVGER